MLYSRKKIRNYFTLDFVSINNFLFFRCLYEAIGGPYRPGKEFIYSVLDWKNKPQKALIFSVLAVIATPVAHTVFCWGIYKLRMTLKSVYLNKWLRYWENRERSN